MTAYEFGKMCAEEGDPFCPETAFVSAGQMGMYAQGFLSIKPDNQAALAFVGGDTDDALMGLRALDLAVDEAQYTPRPGYDF